MPLKPSKKPSTTAKRDHLEHQRLTSLINSMADAVIAVDEKLRVVIYNAATLNLLDVNTLKIGNRLSHFFTPLDEDNQLQDVDALIKSATVPITRRDLCLQYSDDSRINIYISIAPVHLGYGSSGPQGYVLMLRDITREKSLEEERDEFISVVSHELRTPIAIAEGNIGNAEFIVQNSGDIKAIKQALQEAHNQVLFLSDMINDLSTLSRAEGGALQVEVAPINVHELVKELAANYTAEAAAKDLEVRTEIDPQLELLHSSKLYVQEILQNFITNAIKYTPKGSITIGASVAPKGVRFEVQDSGIGISKSDQERVYDKFFRSEDFRTRQANGTGLGLYVTLKLARLIHAELGLTSELNKGSTFTVFIPNLS